MLEPGEAVLNRGAMQQPGMRAKVAYLNRLGIHKYAHGTPNVSGGNGGNYLDDLGLLGSGQSHFSGNNPGQFNPTLGSPGAGNQGLMTGGPPTFNGPPGQGNPHPPPQFLGPPISAGGDPSSPPIQFGNADTLQQVTLPGLQAPPPAGSIVGNGALPMGPVPQGGWQNPNPFNPFARSLSWQGMPLNKTIGGVNLGD